MPDKKINLEQQMIRHCAPVLPAVGIAAWQLATAAITGFIAKENVVGTLATVYAITSLIDTEQSTILHGQQRSM